MNKQHLLLSLSFVFFFPLWNMKFGEGDIGYYSVTVPHTFSKNRVKLLLEKSPEAAFHLYCFAHNRYHPMPDIILEFLNDAKFLYKGQLGPEGRKTVKQCLIILAHGLEFHENDIFYE